jgi:hypothetical protein
MRFVMREGRGGERKPLHLSPKDASCTLTCHTHANPKPARTPNPGRQHLSLGGQDATKDAAPGEDGGCLREEGRELLAASEEDGVELLRLMVEEVPDALLGQPRPDVCLLV